MKHRVAGLVTAAVLTGVVAAVALGGSSVDPLVSKSYLEGTYSQELTEALKKKASETSKSTYDAAKKTLEQAAESHLAAAGKVTGDESGSYAPVNLRAGDQLTLSEGDSLVFYSGSAQVVSGALADVTNGKTVSNGGTLTAAHRYVATAQTVLRQTSDGSLGQEGGQGTIAERKPFAFQDVKQGDWFYEAVAYVYEKGYFSGVSETAFEPNTSMSRAMLATVLYRLSGENYTGEAGFSDVPEESWFTAAVGWASANGIVNGMGGNLFAPDEAVTREQMVTMLYRYQGYKKGNTSARGNLSTFPDGEQVAVWAKESVEWAVGKKLLTGRNTGDLDPTGTATRAEVATILQRFDSMT